MQPAGDAAGLQWQREALREFVDKDVPQALEQCLGRCLSKYGLSQEARLQELQDLLREEHVPLNVALTRLSTQVAQGAAAGGAPGEAGATGARLDQLAAKVDRLVNMIELLDEKVGRSMGELLDEKVGPLMSRLEKMRHELSATPASERGAARAPGRRVLQGTREQESQTNEPPSDRDEGIPEPVAPRHTLGARSHSSMEQQVLETLPDVAEDRLEHVQPEQPWRGLRKRSREYYREQVRSIHDRRLKVHATWLGIMVQSFGFELLFSLVIIAHLIYMVVETDQSFGTQGLGTMGLSFEVTFLAIYIIELALKMGVDGWHFFYGVSWKVNLFDLFLVLTGTIDVIGLFAAEAMLFNTMALKALRVFRLQKVFRIHRVLGMASDTRMVLQGLVACAGVLIGASFLVIIYFLVFGLFFSQAVSSYIVESRDEMDSEILDYYMTNFNTVFKTMFTLYQCVSGGQRWTLTSAALWPVWPGGLLGIVFVVFHFAYLVLIANVVSSVYVQKVLLYSLDQTQSVRLRMERQDRQDAQRILEDCNHNFGEGDTLDYKELLSLLLVTEVRELFDIRGIKLEDVKVLHETLAQKPAELDSPQTWQLHVQRKSFFQLCMRLSRDVSTADFAKAHQTKRHFEAHQTAHNHDTQVSLARLSKQLDNVLHQLRQGLNL